MEKVKPGDKLKARLLDDKIELDRVAPQPERERLTMTREKGVVNDFGVNGYYKQPPMRNLYEEAFSSKGKEKKKTPWEIKHGRR
jgi:hypothetical protein